MLKAVLILATTILMFPFTIFGETAVIVDKQNEYNGCTVEVTYDEKDLIRESIDWIRSLHYFDYYWELRKAEDFYPDKGGKGKKDRAKRVILFDRNGKEESVTVYDRQGEVIERIVF